MNAADLGPLYAWRQNADGSVQMRPVIRRRAILRLEAIMRGEAEARGEYTGPGCTDELCPLTHHFAPGLYAREIFIPAGVTIIGKIHRHAHVNTISLGHVLVGTEFGPQELRAPHSFISKPGTKRVVVAITDTIWTTYHPTHLTDVEAIERAIIAPTFDALRLEPAQTQALLEGEAA